MGQSDTVKDSAIKKENRNDDRNELALDIPSPPAEMNQQQKKSKIVSNFIPKLNVKRKINSPPSPKEIKSLQSPISSKESSPPPTSASASYQIGNYQVGKTIGSGTFGNVKIAHHKNTGEAVAIKFLCRKKIRDMDVAKKIMQEVRNQKFLHHPHVTKLYDTISCPSHIIMIMEYVEGGDLFDYITGPGHLSEVESRRLFQQIISAVDFLHRNNVVHRDLKPENILITKTKNIKLADFGLSRHLGDGDFLSTSCGSPNYAAPEVICGNLYGGPEVDFWSSGVILYAMLTGSLPFSDEHLPTLFKKIKAGKYRIPESIVDPNLIKLMKSLLTVDPSLRAKTAEILANPWFQTELPRHLFTPILGRPQMAILERRIIEEVCEELGIEEEEVMDAAEHEKDIVANDDFKLVRLQVQRIADRILDDAKRCDLAHLLNVVVPVDDPIHDWPVASQLKWNLGLRSFSNPAEIMLELFRALKELDFEWRILGTYQLIIRRKARPGADHWSKLHIFVNLLKLDHQAKVNYILDFKLMPLELRNAEVQTPSRNFSTISGSFTSPKNRDEIFPRRFLTDSFRKGREIFFNDKNRKRSCGGRIESNFVDKFQSMEICDENLNEEKIEKFPVSELMLFFELCSALVARLILVPKSV